MQKYTGPSLDVWREYFNYNEITGHFTVKIKRSIKKPVGARAENRRSDKYLTLYFSHAQYYAHHVAWYFIYGQWPKSELDHRDLDPGNNSKKNIRRATRSSNVGNTRRPKTNTSGVKGVHWRKDRKNWVAAITCRRRRRFLGSFNSIADAAAAYSKAAIKFQGEFARTA